MMDEREVFGLFLVLLAVVGGVGVYNVNEWMTHSELKDFVKSMPTDVSVLNGTPEKIEIITKSEECPYTLFRITKDKIIVKCGWSKVYEATIKTEYFRTYGKDRWVRNRRKVRSVELYLNLSGGVRVRRNTMYYKGRSGTDGVLSETFLVTKDKIKHSFLYSPENDAFHKVIISVKESEGNVGFKYKDPFGNFKRQEGLDFIYGEVKGDIFVDPEIKMLKKSDFGKLISNTEYCFECETVYEVCNPSLVEKEPPRIGFVGDAINRAEVLIEIPHIVLKNLSSVNCTQYQEVVYFEGENYTTETKEHCVETPEQKEVVERVFTPLDELGSIPSGVCYNVRVKGFLKSGARVDNIMNFSGKSYKEWVWWNNNWNTSVSVDIKTDVNMTGDPIRLVFNSSLVDFSDMMVDRNDTRIIDENDSFAYNLYIENFTDENITVWVNITSINTDDNLTLKFYYNVTSAVDSVSNGSWVFRFYTSCEDSETWEGTGSITNTTGGKVGENYCSIDISNNKVLYKSVNLTNNTGDSWTIEGWYNGTSGAQIYFGLAHTYPYSWAGHQDFTTLIRDVQGATYFDTHNDTSDLWENVAERTDKHWFRFRHTINYTYPVQSPATYSYNSEGFGVNLTYAIPSIDQTSANASIKAIVFAESANNPGAILGADEILVYNTYGRDVILNPTPSNLNAPNVTVPVLDDLSPILNESNLTCNTTYKDDDGDVGNLTFNWSVNGNVVYVEEFNGVENNTLYNSTLAFENFSNGGDTIDCKVRAFDGIYYSGWFSSDTATVVLPSANISLAINYTEGNTIWEFNSTFPINATTDLGTNICISVGVPGVGNDVACNDTAVSYNLTVDKQQISSFDGSATKLLAIYNSTPTWAANFSTTEPFTNRTGVIAGFNGSQEAMLYLWDNQTNYVHLVQIWVNSVGTNIPEQLRFQLMEQDNRNSTEMGKIVGELCNVSFNENEWNNLTFDVETDPNKYISLYIFEDHDCDGVESANTTQNVLLELNKSYNGTGYHIANWRVNGVWDPRLIYNPSVRWFFDRKETYLQPSYINFSVESAIDLMGYQVNISGEVNETFPKNIGFDYDNDGNLDDTIDGVIVKGDIYLEHFDNNKTKETIDFSQPRTLVRNFKLRENSSIVFAKLNFTFIKLESKEYFNDETTTHLSRTKWAGQFFNTSTYENTSRFSFFVESKDNIESCEVVNVTNWVNVTIQSGNVTNTTGWNDCNMTTLGLVPDQNYLFRVNMGGGLSDKASAGGDNTNGYWCVSTGGDPWCPVGLDMSFRLYTETFPFNITVDVGYDGKLEFNNTGVLSNSTIVDLNVSAVQNHTNGTYCDGHNCVVPLGISVAGGRINITGINITQRDALLLKFNHSKFKTQLNKSKLSNLTNLSLKVVGVREGLLNFSVLNVSFLGRQNFTINATAGSNTTFWNISVIYSALNISTAYEFLEFFPGSLSAKNVTPYGQTTNLSYFNITYNAYADSMNVSISLNESVGDCFNITFSINNSKDNGSVVLTTNQTYRANLNVSEVMQGWVWLDMSGCNSTSFRYFNPEFLIDTCCYHCTPCWEG